MHPQPTQGIGGVSGVPSSVEALENIGEMGHWGFEGLSGLKLGNDRVCCLIGKRTLTTFEFKSNVNFWEVLLRLKFAFFLLCFAWVGSYSADGAPVLPGSAAPMFSKTDLRSNSRVVTRAWIDSGYAVVVNFGASFCAPCKIELPWLWSQIQQRPQLRMVWVLAESEFLAKQQNFLNNLRYSGPVVQDESGVLRRRFGAGDALPFSVLIGRDGSVARTFSGFEIADTTVWLGALDAL